MTEEIGYIVLRLSTELESPEYRVKLTSEGMLGMVPVYATVEKAKEYSENGKYPVIACLLKSAD